MGNGHGPPILKDDDYQTIKSGTLVTSGPNGGSILVGSTYYWVENQTDTWKLHDGPQDDELISYLTADVWDRCKAAGTYTWDSSSETWYDGGRQGYRWDGEPEGDVELVAV
jgi:hypothetical protein